jgi:hypothetical protein
MKRYRITRVAVTSEGERLYLYRPDKPGKSFEAWDEGVIGMIEDGRAEFYVQRGGFQSKVAVEYTKAGKSHLVEVQGRRRLRDLEWLTGKQRKIS